MGWIAFLLTSHLLTTEIEEFVHTSIKAQEASVQEIAQEKLPAKSEKKCSAGSIQHEFHESSSPKLLVFISFSVPLETWKEYSTHLVENGGVFVLRGLPENSFQNLSQRIQELRAERVFAQIIIDPDLFEKHQVTAVPSIVLENAGRTDKITGNITLASAYRFFQVQGGMDAK